MKISLGLLLLLTVYLLVRNRNLRCKIKKDVEQEEKLMEDKEAAKRVLPQLRKMRASRSGPYADFLRNYESVNKDDWGSLANLHFSKYSVTMLGEVGTTVEEADAFKAIADEQCEWEQCMKRIHESDYSVSTFDYYLELREKFLQESGRTLRDFGIMQDDTEDLRRAFCIRFAKHKQLSILKELATAEQELAEFKTEQNVFKFDDDFGFGQVRAQLDRLANLK